MPTVTPIRTPPVAPHLLGGQGAPPLLENAAGKPKEEQAELKEAFRDFTAGTVFKQMLKSLRKMHDKPAYLHGGQGEETFRALLDEKVAESLAESHGGAIADPLFAAFANRVPVHGTGS